MMTTFTLAVEGFTSVVGDMEFMPQLWRVKHDIELGDLWRWKVPEVHPFSPGHFTPFNEAWQRTSFAMNPCLTPDKWTAVYSCHRAFTNNQAWDCRCAANYIEGENLNCELPKVEALVCGGAYLAGVPSGDVLVVQTLDGRATPPSLGWLLDRPWLYFHAITIDGNGKPNPFPQCDGQPILIPLIADPSRYSTITFPLWKLEKLDMSKPLPSPYEVFK